MLKKITFILAILITPVIALAQQNYFQQEVNYKIHCSLNDNNHTLSANIQIDYINRSKDTLTYIYIHLWPNGYKDKNTALCQQELNQGNSALYFAEEKDRGYIDSLNFMVNAKPAQIEFDGINNDFCKLVLNEPLYPGQRAVITTPFKVKIPNGKFSRLGHIGQAYAITQWYPKPAVYDQFGWHNMPYLNQGEFYSEYGSFDVYLTLPENYIVGATGDLIEDATTDNAAEINRMNGLAVATMNQVDVLIPTEKKDMSFPKSSDKLKTIHFHQEKIHDFGWFADKRYHVLKDEIVLERTGKKVTTWSLFTNNEYKLWMKSPEYIKDALKYYSNWIGDYPYNQCTAVDGTIAAGGGMEYPNVTIIGASGNAKTLETTIVHEVGHNWFYGIFGSNEREHPWMDEGINSFYEMRYNLSKYPPQAEYKSNSLSEGLGGLNKFIGLDKFDYKDAFGFAYNLSAAENNDQPIELHAAAYTSMNYGTIVYMKTGYVMNYLKSFLGDDQFDNCMRTYFDRWAFKHPYPENLQNVFEEVSGKNLNWFFKDLVNSDNKIDYKIASIKKTGANYDLKIKNNGQLQTPFLLAGMKDGKVANSKWIAPNTIGEKVTFNCNNCDFICIDPNNDMPDVNRINNSVRTQGILKKVDPFRVNFIGKMNYPVKNTVYLAPAIGYNYHNGWMGGLLIHNYFLPKRNFEFAIAPMFGFKNQQFAGIGNVNYTLQMKEGLLKNIVVGVDARRFAFENNEESKTQSSNFEKMNPYLLFNIRNRERLSKVRQSVRLNFNNIKEDYWYDKKNDVNLFTHLTYSYENNRTLDPWKVNLQVENNKSFNKVSIDYTYKFSYKQVKKGVYVRVFAGGLINGNLSNLNDGYGVNMSDGLNYYNSTITYDYGYDRNYLGRNLPRTNFLSKQIFTDQGGFKIYTPIANNATWASSVNITADCPIPLPFRFFFDAGMSESYQIDVTTNITKSQTALVYEAGVTFALIKDIAEVYFPLMASKNIMNYFDNKKFNYSERIRFKFDISKLNPLLLRKQLSN
jgi:hypothetical protein